MFLKRPVSARTEDGSALVAVLGVFAMGLILTTLIVSSVVHGLGASTSSRASVQSQAAADAGIAAARVALYTASNCSAQSTPGVYVSASSPQYRVTVERNNGAGWVTGCPNLLTSQVRLTSTGTAAASGVAGNSAGDLSKVQAVYDYLVPGVSPSGVAMYFHDGAVIEANSSLDLSEGGNTGLMVKNGTLTCAKNNGVVNGSLLIKGNLTFGGSCEVTGSAVVSGLTTLGSSGRIDGNLTSGSVSPNPPGSKVGGTYTQSAAAPAVPDWVNLTFAPTEWLTSAGLPYELRTAGLLGIGCTLTSNYGGLVPGYPVILDARGCSTGIGASGTISLTSDVVIFANKFDFNNNLEFKSSTSTVRRLWFITPDNGPAGDKSPTCGSDQGNFSPNNSFTIAPTVSAMLYTPCAFESKNNFTWNGQIYAGKVSAVKNNPSFSFVAVGAAGVDFDQAPVTTQVTKPQPGGLISMRNLNG